MARVAAQLYTVRDYTATAAGFGAALHRIAEIGYRSVQLSAVGCMNGESPEVDARTARRMLDDAGLAAPLTHRPWDEIHDRTDECIAFHRELGAELVALGSIPSAYRELGLDGYRRFVADAEPVIANLKDAGLKFAYHNHAFEFERMAPLWQSPFDIMMKHGSPDFLFEVDTYWVVHAGVDLVDLAGKLQGRIPMIHVKDKSPVGNEVRMAPVGEGNLNWAAILPACESAGSELYAVEQDDCYGRDPFDCLESSFRFLSEHAPS